MLYSEEDVEQIKKRAEVLSLLARSDNVSEEQLRLIKGLYQQEARHNRQSLPALEEYERFLNGVLELQGAELDQERQKTAQLQAARANLEKRKKALDEQLGSRHELDAQRARVDEAKARAAEAEQEMGRLRSQIVANEESLTKLNVTDVSTLVEQDKGLALQRAELATLEKEYLKAEETIFSLSRDLRDVGESNAELLRICDQLMKKMEARK